jgi:uncharacterized membrane protein
MSFVRSSKGDFTTFDVPGADITVGEGINNAGTIVGVYENPPITPTTPNHGFVSNNGVVFTTVDVHDAKETQINSINAKGEIVGFYIDSTDVEHGFLGVPIR